MNKKTSFILALVSLLIFPIIALNYTSGQIIADGDLLTEQTDQAGSVSGLGTPGIEEIAVRGVRVILSLLAIIFLALTLVSGFKWMTAAGNKETVEKAQSVIKNAVIGLVIVLAAYAITYFIFRNIPFGASTHIGTGTSG